MTLRSIPLLVAFLYVHGLVMGSVYLGFRTVTGRGLPALAWWQWLIGPLVLGASIVGLWLLLSFMADGFAFDRTQSRARLIAGKVGIVAIVLLLLIGVTLYLMSRP